MTTPHEKAVESALIAWRESTEWVVEVRMEKATTAYLSAIIPPDVAGLVKKARAEKDDAVAWGGGVMKQWDSWRKYIADGGKGSWPRDAFESLIDCLVGRTDELCAAIERVARERDAAQARIAALEGALRAAMDDTPGWYDLARAALADALAPKGGDKE